MKCMLFWCSAKNCDVRQSINALRYRLIPIHSVVLIVIMIIKIDIYFG